MDLISGKERKTPLVMALDCKEHDRKVAVVTAIVQTYGTTLPAADIEWLLEEIVNDVTAVHSGSRLLDVHMRV